ncbi:MAG: hypothetical protein EXR77_18775 [Myxococcales bacterium]|nr:hypothetical protein [Myxococcales bacterium]
MVPSCPSCSRGRWPSHRSSWRCCTRWGICWQDKRNCLPSGSNAPSPCCKPLGWMPNTRCCCCAVCRGRCVCSSRRPSRLRPWLRAWSMCSCRHWRPLMRKVKSDPLVVEGQRRVAELRMQMLSLYPFWGYLLAELQLLWAPDLPALAATDGVARVWLNPRWIAHLNRKQLGFVLLHELGHVVQETLERQEVRQRHLWNRATDYAINRQVAQIPVRGGAASSRAWQVPSGDIAGLGECAPLLNPAFDHLPAEGIYAKLLKNPTCEGDGGDAVELTDADGLAVRSHPNHGGGLDIHVPIRGDVEVQQQLRDRASTRLQQAAEAAKELNPGENLPLGVDRWLAGLRKPRLSWQTLIQRYLNDFGASVERSWARPHRRWLAEGWLVPGAVPERDGAVVLAVDTSGSVNPQQLQAIASELGALGDRVGELWVVCADAAVHEVVAPGELAEFLKKCRWKGGGGTDHRPVFEWVREQRLRPELLICCTDLYTQLPERRPGYPVLWLALADSEGRYGPRPGFGEVVVVEGLV